MITETVKESMLAELVKIAEGDSVDAPSSSIQGEVQQGSDGAAADASPVHGIVAAKVEQIGAHKARGIPVIQPPPGYVYSPELQAFKPNQSDQGWMTAQQQAEAAKAKAYYDKGKEDMATQAQQQQQASAQQQQQQEMATQQRQVQIQAMRQKQQAAAARMKSKQQKSAVLGVGANLQQAAPTQQKGVVVSLGK